MSDTSYELHRWTNTRFHSGWEDYGEHDTLDEVNEEIEHFDNLHGKGKYRIVKIAHIETIIRNDKE